MLKLYPLFSGSSGNMYLIKSPTSAILVDIGVSFKQLTNSLDMLNMSIDDISALLITHEHTDHTKGLTTFINKTDIPIYLTNGTSSYLKEKLKSKIKKDFSCFNTINEKFNIKDIEITPFETSHDAVDPVGYTITNNDSTLTIATDLGYVTDNVYEQLVSSDFCVIESNYDRNLLMYGPYSYPLKCRIQSNLGHLCNETTADTIVRLAKDGKRNFLLGHISRNNNEPEQALFEVRQSLVKNGFDLSNFNISCASHEASYEVYDL